MNESSNKNERHNDMPGNRDTHLLPKKYFIDERINGTFQEVWSIINILRRECPWDRKQTTESVKFKLIEESYEALQCIDEMDWEKFKKELGDIILVTLFHIKIMEDNGTFTLSDVFRELVTKLIDRHPHVFGKKELKTADDVLKNWEKSKGKSIKETDFNFSMPALYLAYRVIEKLKHRDELKREINSQDIQDKIEKALKNIFEKRSKSPVWEISENKDLHVHIEKEIGEVLFLLTVISAEIGINPEDALRKKVKEFFDKLPDKSK